MDPSDVLTGDQRPFGVGGTGQVPLFLKCNGSSVQCRLQIGMLVPMLKYHLLSVQALTKQNAIVSFGPDSCEIRKNNYLSARGSLNGNSYCSNTFAKNKELQTALTTDLDLWQARFAHVSSDCIKQLITEKVVDVLKLDASFKTGPCQSCIIGKRTKVPVPKRKANCSKSSSDLVRSDIGTMPVESLGGSKCHVTFIDDYTRFSWAYTMKSKSEVVLKFKVWLALVTNQCRWKLKKLQGDRGREYLSTDFSLF